MTEPEQGFDSDRGTERLYRDAASEQPPAALDKQILQAAHAAVAAKPPARGPFAGRWTVGLSAAAVVVLAVGVLFRLLPEALSPPSTDSLPALQSDDAMPVQESIERKADTRPRALLAPAPATTAEPARSEAFSDRADAVQGLYKQRQSGKESASTQTSGAADVAESESEAAMAAPAGASISVEKRLRQQTESLRAAEAPVLDPATWRSTIERLISDGKLAEARSELARLIAVHGEAAAGDLADALTLPETRPASVE